MTTTSLPPPERRSVPIRGRAKRDQRGRKVYYGGLDRTCGVDAAGCVRAWTLVWLLLGKPDDKVECRRLVADGEFSIDGGAKIRDPNAPVKVYPGREFRVGRTIGVFR